VVAIVPQLGQDVDEDQDAARHSNRETGDVDHRVRLSLSGVSERGLEVMGEHDEDPPGTLFYILE
jgi:hypothetical protein